jgi:hypothetical protein
LHLKRAVPAVDQAERRSAGRHRCRPECRRNSDVALILLVYVLLVFVVDAVAVVMRRLAA